MSGISRAQQARRRKTGTAVSTTGLPLAATFRATEPVMDSPACIAVDEAENRLHVQKAVMAALVESAGTTSSRSIP